MSGSEGFTHLDEAGHAVMVDISAKEATSRLAVARGRIAIRPDVIALIVDGKTPKGDVLATARIAGIMAAKKTSDLIPLCHPLALSSIKIEMTIEADGIVIEAAVKTFGPTGVEMEALTAVTVSSLTIYDMCKALDRSMRIELIQLMQKSGGRSGDVKALG